MFSPPLPSMLLGLIHSLLPREYLLGLDSGLIIARARNSGRVRGQSGRCPLPSLLPHHYDRGCIPQDKSCQMAVPILGRWALSRLQRPSSLSSSIRPKVVNGFHCCQSLEASLPHVYAFTCSYLLNSSSIILLSLIFKPEVCFLWETQYCSALWIVILYVDETYINSMFSLRMKLVLRCLGGSVS